MDPDPASTMQVRAAVPMYLLSRKIKALGFKVVMSGEGADEVFGGYLYFHKAPNAAEFHRYTILLPNLRATEVDPQRSWPSHRIAVAMQSCCEPYW